MMMAKAMRQQVPLRPLFLHSMSSLVVTERHYNGSRCHTTTSLLSSSSSSSLPVMMLSFHTTNTTTTRRMFQTEADFHTVADTTLESIQDNMERLLEQVQSSSSSSEDHNDHDHDEFEVDYASGVLTIHIPPHGTWVLNKQTPNRQIWWSSPISGPRRYEYENETWTYTRSDGGADTLGQALAKEMKELYPQLTTEDANLHELQLQ